MNRTADQLTPADFRSWLDRQDPRKVIAVAETATESPLSSFLSEEMGEKLFASLDGIARSFEGRVERPLPDWMHRFTLYFDAELAERATVCLVRQALTRACPTARA